MFAVVRDHRGLAVVGHFETRKLAKRYARILRGRQPGKFVVVEVW